MQIGFPILSGFVKPSLKELPEGKLPPEEEDCEDFSLTTYSTNNSLSTTKLLM